MRSAREFDAARATRIGEIARERELERVIALELIACAILANAGPIGALLAAGFFVLVCSTQGARKRRLEELEK